MLLNDVLILEIFTTLLLVFYTTSLNLLTLLYVGGLYLFALSIFLFINDLDIYVGFLLVIDLGVGLVFFIFILHFTLFLFQKSIFNLLYRYYIYIIIFGFFIISFFYYNVLYSGWFNTKDTFKLWFFKLTYNDYYTVLNTYEVTELNLLLDSYFNLNTWEFFIINFHLFFGLITAIILFFTIHKVFNFLNFSQINDLKILKNLDSNFFIRNQNFTNQINTPGLTSIWGKTRR